MASFEGHTWHIVTSDTQAKRLALAFDGSCIIDRSLMHYPPERMPSGDHGCLQYDPTFLVAIVVSVRGNVIVTLTDGGDSIAVRAGPRKRVAHSQYPAFGNFPEKNLSGYAPIEGHPAPGATP